MGAQSTAAASYRSTLAIGPWSGHLRTRARWPELDRGARTAATLTGDPESCNVACSTVAVEACVDADGCCPAACNLNTDSDCGTRCGDGIVSGAETCDGDCPATCDDGDPCTRNLRIGGGCEVKCDYPHLDDTCDGVDDDCDGTTDEDYSRLIVCGGVGYCRQGAALQTCAPGGTLVDACPPPRAPLGPDTTCDGVDDDCDGDSDEEWVLRMVSCGLGVCAGDAPVSCLGGQEYPPWELAMCVRPSTEVCNGLDDNCDGTTDDGLVCP